VHTIPLPERVSAQQVGLTLRQHHWHVGFESGYLRARNWLQLCLMGEYEPTALRALPEAVASAITQVTGVTSAYSGAGEFAQHEASHFSHHLVNGRALV
jgi:hypothetical protein